MKKLILILITFTLFGCQPFDIEYINPNQNNIINPPVFSQSLDVGIPVIDFIPALQPFVNEGCNTAWDNLSAIRNADGTLTYFSSLLDYTEDSLDLDKARFTFIYQAQNPWYGTQWDDGTEEPYTQIAGSGWLMLPIDDYGSMTCNGLQKIRIWVLDELTGTWYMNSQVCWAGYLCNGQGDCDQGWTFDQIEYADYSLDYRVLTPINGY